MQPTLDVAYILGITCLDDRPQGTPGEGGPGWDIRVGVLRGIAPIPATVYHEAALDPGIL